MNTTYRTTKADIGNNDMSFIDDVITEEDEDESYDDGERG
jgi:hypothetical protein